MRKILTLIAAVSVATLVAAPVAAAPMAPTYVSSQPEDGEEVHEVPEKVEVTFSEPLDESSELSVKDSCGRKVDDGDVAIDGNTMSVGISLKPSGHYQVSYSATGVAGVTGSTEGGFHFMVHFGEPCNRDTKRRHGQHGDNDDRDDNDGNATHNNHGDDGSSSDEEPGDHMPSGHSSSGGTPTHSSMSGRDASAGAAGAKHTRMQRGRHEMKRNDSNKQTRHGRPKTTVASPDGRTLASGSDRPVAPDGRAVLLALGFSLALGAVGGWFLRITASR